MNKTATAIIFGLGGVIIGAAASYILTKKYLNEHYEELVQEEIASVKEQYRLLRKDGIQPGDLKKARLKNEASGADVFGQQVSTIGPEDRAKTERLIEELGYAERAKREDVEEHKRQSDMVEPPRGEVRTAEEPRKMTIEEETPIDPEDEELLELYETRNTSAPYVITVDEFMDDEKDHHDKISMTYFDGDDSGVLIDDSERVIDDIESIVGYDALTKFGKFSKDKNIVYVRNEEMESDFEIVLDERSYVEAIAGLRPKNGQKKYKMREDD